jgi:cytochrome c biogenesis protein CcmG, thiol:disulfide interchange protein DsbE
MRRGRVLGWAVGLVLLAAALVVGLAPNGSSGHPRAAPTLPREDLVAPSVTVADLHGHPAFVTFWAGWCGPCEHEAPVLQRFSQGLGGRARLIGVNWSDGLADARAFIRKYHWTFTSLRDGSGEVGRSYGVTGLPTTFVLDGQGQVRETLRGPQTAQTLAQALSQITHE